MQACELDEGGVCSSKREENMSLITVEVEIDHGALTAKESHLLPEQGVGLLTILRSGRGSTPPRIRVRLPLVRCVPGTIVKPTAEELDASLWD
jgi:hypothetical protein